MDQKEYEQMIAAYTKKVIDPINEQIVRYVPVFKPTKRSVTINLSEPDKAKQIRYNPNQVLRPVISPDGPYKSVPEAARITGIPAVTIYTRCARKLKGWSYGD